VVAHPGAPGRAGRIRQLNRPRPLRVEASDESRPLAVWLRGRRCAVEAVLETWRIDDEWWRERLISRRYWQVVLDDGRTLVTYQDLVSKRWCSQSY